MRSVQPKTLWLTVNRGCNFRCEWCYAGATGYGSEDDMTLDFAKEITLLSQEAGVTTVLLIGGEPTLWKELFSFNEFCRGIGVKTILVTNGARFASDKFSDQYAGSPCDVIGVSVKGVDPEQLRKVTGSGGFDRVERGLIRAIRDFGAHVNITYSDLARGRLADMIQKVVDWGAESIKIEFCSTTFTGGNASSEHMIPPGSLVREIVNVFPELERITSGKIVLDMMTPLCLWPEDFIRDLYGRGRMLSVCHVHKRRGLIVDAAGRVIMCNALFEYPLGTYGVDFMDAEGLITWLNSDRILGYYDGINAYPTLVCSKCSWYAECAGGCPLKWAAYKPDDLVRSMQKPLTFKE